MQVDAAAAPALPRNGEYPLIDLGLDAISRQFDALASGAGTPAGESMPARPLPARRSSSSPSGKALRLRMRTFNTGHADRSRLSTAESMHRYRGDERARRDALDRGVHYRVVYDPAAFKRESRARWVRVPPFTNPVRASPRSFRPAWSFATGKNRLVFSSANHPSGVLGVRIHDPWFAAFLNDTFETIWRSATPPANDRMATSPRLSSEEQEILRLLATGLTDDSIARALGVSLRTIQRKVQPSREVSGQQAAFSWEP